MNNHVPPYNPKMIISQLCRHFPKCFFEEGRLRRALKRDIADDIESLHIPELGGLKVREAVDYYNNHYGVWKATVAGAQRIDLDGNPAGKVTPMEAQVAITRIVEINAMKNALGDFNPHVSPAQPATRIESMIKPILDAPPLSDTELLQRVTRKMKRVERVLAEEDDDGLRGEVAAPLLKSVLEDTKLLYDRVRG